jgi:hypothetical protein
MVTCAFFSTFLIFLHFSLLCFVFIYSCPLFILVAFLVVTELWFFFSASDTVQKRQAVINRYVQHSASDVCTLSSDTVENKKIYFELQQTAKLSNLFFFSVSEFKSLRSLFVTAVISYSIRKIGLMSEN